MGFPTPEQGDKFKMPVAHTHLIKVESPPSWGVVSMTLHLTYAFEVIILPNKRVIALFQLLRQLMSGKDNAAKADNFLGQISQLCVVT